MTMASKMIVFDMDGTIADLYGVPNWLSKLQAEDPSPYAEAEPMCDMERLRDVLLSLSMKGWEIRVVSWLSKDSSREYKAAVRKAKREWLARYNFPADKVHLVAYGTTKSTVVRKAAESAILIDDSAEVRDGWHLGETIDPMEVDLVEVLENLGRG